MIPHSDDKNSCGNRTASWNAATSPKEVGVVKNGPRMYGGSAVGSGGNAAGAAEDTG